MIGKDAVKTTETLDEEAAGISAVDRGSIARDATSGRHDSITMIDAERTTSLMANQTSSDKSLVSTTVDLDTNANPASAILEAGEIVENSEENSQISGETSTGGTSPNRKRVDEDDWDEYDRHRMHSVPTPKKQTKGSSYRPGYQIPCDSTPRIRERQSIERDPIDDRSIVW